MDTTGMRRSPRFHPAQRLRTVLVMTDENGLPLRVMRRARHRRERASVKGNLIPVAPREADVV
jgi:hypothetical protein